MSDNLKPARRPVTLQVPFRHHREQIIPWTGDTMRPVELSVGGERCYDGQPTVELSLDPDEARYLAQRLCAMADSWGEPR